MGTSKDNVEYITSSYEDKAWDFKGETFNYKIVAMDDF